MIYSFLAQLVFLLLQYALHRRLCALAGALFGSERITIVSTSGVVIITAPTYVTNIRV